MKYILDEFEMQEVRNLRAVVTNLPKLNDLQKFCTMVADTLPIKVSWREQARPWGCILTKEDEWYCDECPAEHICPNQDKEWSQ
jgi:hypothetical protein